jgi:hypothetical protein
METDGHDKLEKFKELIRSDRSEISQKISE